MSGIIRIKKREPGFVMIDNRVVTDTRLSWKAKGLLVYLLSKPDNWTTRVADLVKQSSDGEYAVRSALAELIDAGYITRTTERACNGTFLSWNYTVYEQPLRGFPDVGNPDAGNPDAGNRVLNNTDLNNTDLNNTDHHQEEEEEIAPTKNGRHGDRHKNGSYQNVFQAYESEIGPLTPTIGMDLEIALGKYPEEWIIAALQEAARNNARAWSYANAILKRWQADGFQSVRKREEANAEPYDRYKEYPVFHAGNQESS